MAVSPQYGNQPNIGALATNQLTVSNVNTDGATGTYITFFTAGKYGANVPSFQVTPCQKVASGATAATKVRVFISDGTNKRLLCEIPMPVYTPSISAANPGVLYTNPVPNLPPNAVLLANIDVAPTDPTNIFANGGDL